MTTYGRDSLSLGAARAGSLYTDWIPKELMASVAQHPIDGYKVADRAGTTAVIGETVQLLINEKVRMDHRAGFYCWWGA